jgi:hypothetical protein
MVKALRQNRAEMTKKQSYWRVKADTFRFSELAIILKAPIALTSFPVSSLHVNVPYWIPRSTKMLILLPFQNVYFPGIPEVFTQHYIILIRIIICGRYVLR